MNRLIRVLGTVLGLVIATALLRGPQPAEAQPVCENEQCLDTCAGGTCWEDCVEWPNWHCAGGGGWCVSVQCPTPE